MSDSDPDDINKLLEGIDFSDDEAPKKSNSKIGKSNLKPQNSAPVERNNNSNGVSKKKIQFSEDTKSLAGEEKNNKIQDSSSVMSKPATERPNSGGRRRTNQITFDDDDDLLSGLDDFGKKKTSTTTVPTTTTAASSKPISKSKSSSNFMDDLFGDSKISAATKTNETKEVKKEFVLSDQYKQQNLNKSNKLQAAAATTVTTATTSSSLSVPSLDPLKARPRSAGIAGRGERRRGAPTTESKLDLDFDDDKLFQGTSLATNNNISSVPDMGTKAAKASATPEITVTKTPSTVVPPPWENPKPSKPPNPVYTAKETIITDSSELQPETREMIQKHKLQMEQLQRLEKDQLDQFQKDLEDQKAFIESKQRDHRLALEQQKSLCQNQVIAMQEKQSSLLKQQQIQMESMMQQIQMQMESELRIKNELMRNQLKMMSEMQVSKDSGLDLRSLVDDFKLKPSGQIEGKIDENVLERLKEAHNEHVSELETRIKDLQTRAKEMAEYHKEEMEAEKSTWKERLKVQQEEHLEAMQALKTEYTISLDRVREAQRETERSEQEAGIVSKNLKSLLDQVNVNTNEVNQMSDKVDSKLLRNLDVRETLIQQKESRIQELMEKIERMQNDHELEVSELRNENKSFEIEMKGKTIEIEKRTEIAAKLELEVETKRRKFGLEKELATVKIESEKQNIKDERKLIQYEWNELKKFLRSQSQNAVREKVSTFLKEKDGTMNFAISSRQLAAHVSNENHVELEGILLALEEQKIALEKSKENLKSQELKLKEDKKHRREEKNSILEAVSRLAEVERKLDQKIGEFQDFAEICQGLRKDCQNHLDMCQKLTRERSEVRDELKFQLEEFERKEFQMEERKKRLQAERKKLWHTRNNLICQACKGPYQLNQLNDEIQHQGAENWQNTESRTAGDGQNQLLTSHLASMKKASQLDEEFLKRESEYLKTILK